MDIDSIATLKMQALVVANIEKITEPGVASTGFCRFWRGVTFTPGNWRESDRYLEPVYSLSGEKVSLSVTVSVT
ncbi:MAG: hypothetical protein ACKOQ2_12960 [Dolichospermum sp.]